MRTKTVSNLIKKIEKAIIVDTYIKVNNKIIFIGYNTTGEEIYLSFRDKNGFSESIDTVKRLKFIIENDYLIQ